MSALVVLPNFSFPKEPVVQRNRLCHIPVRLTRDAPRFRMDLLNGEIVLFMPVPTPQGDVKSSLFQAKRNKSVSDDVKANNATPLGTSRLWPLDPLPARMLVDGENAGRQLEEGEFEAMGGEFKGNQ